jgi:small subunit ribosomal protein S20
MACLRGQVCKRISDRCGWVFSKKILPPFHKPLLLPSNFKKMANHKATKKDMRQAAKRRDRNRYYGKTTRNAIRSLNATTDVAAMVAGAPDVVAMIDKLAKRGVIHKNKAANLVSKLTRRVNAAKAVPATA